MKIIEKIKAALYVTLGYWVEWIALTAIVVICAIAS